MATILAISSHVARGSVGLAATVPALQWLSHEVWAVPTVLLASRPGLGRPARYDLPPGDLAATLAALEEDGCWSRLDAVLTGYFPSPQSVVVAAEAVSRIRQTAPGIPVLVDPIIGDGGKLYVAEGTAAAIRDALLPLATIATPNLFELTWLTGTSAHDQAAVADAARALGPATVVVTSASETPDSVTTFVVARGQAIRRSVPRRLSLPNGAGDLLAGLYLGYLLRGHDPAATLEASLTDLDRVLAASTGRDVLSLPALRAPGESAV
jgi:pyridoxine kinase